jgi:molybdate transport system regulatory protein
MSMKLGYKLWFEVDGQNVMGPGRAELLTAIDETGSLSAAARKLGLSYRHAYQLIQSLNDRCGQPVIESSIGGKTGGGTRLTVFGRELISMFEQSNDKIQSEADDIDAELNCFCSSGDE